MKKLSKQQYYPWLIVLACCSLAIQMGMTSNAAGVFFMPVANDLGVGVSSVSFYTTIISLMTALMGPTFVRLLGKFKIGPLLAIFGAGAAAAYCSFSLYHSVPMFYIAALIAGIGMAAISTLTVNLLLSQWFHSAVGTVTGLVFAFTGVGGACFSVIFERIISTAGWRTAYIVEGLIIAVLSIFFGLFVIKRTPAEIGLHAFGESDDVNHTSVKVQKSMGVSHKTAVILAWIFACISFLTVAFNSHLSPYAVSEGMDSAFGAYMVSACMVANIVSKLILGSISDRIGVIRSVTIFAVLGIVGSLILFRLGECSRIVALIGAVAMGTQFAINSVGIPIVLRYLVSPDRFDKTYATINLGTLALFALMITGYGSLYDLFGTYFVSNMIVFILCIMMCVLCAVMLVIEAKAAKNRA